MTRTGPGFLTRRIVHVHLTTRCNLACGHCYSSSGPAGGRDLPAPDLLDGLARLRAEGYDAVSLSGGEPLLLPRLPELVRAMSALGYLVSVVTNGTLLRSRRGLASAAVCDSVAVSVDGPPEHHDRIRGSAGAFRRTAQGIDRLRDAGIRFGITSTVDRDVLPYVPDLHAWAREQGAELLGLRPLAPVGRAALAMPDQGLTPAELARLVLMSRLLDDAVLRVHTDAAPIDLLVANRRAAFPRPAESMSDLVNPLIVTEDGSLRPYAYGMPGRHDLGTIAETGQAVERFRDGGAARIHALIDHAFSRLPAEGCVDWHAHLTSAMGEGRRQPADLRR